MLNPFVYPKENPVILKSSPPFISVVIFIGFTDTESRFQPFVSIFLPDEDDAETLLLELANCAETDVTIANKQHVK